MPIAADAKEMQVDLARFRHALHREPEIGLDLPRTQEKVLKALDGLPYEITLGKDTTESEVDRTIDAVVETVERVRQLVGTPA